MNCVLTQIAADIQRDCNVNPQAGLFDEVVVINYDDVDFSGSTMDADGLTLTDLKLKTGKRGYKLGGIKDMHHLSFELAKGKFGKYYKHKYAGVLLNPDKEARAELLKLLGGKVIVVGRRKYNGTAQFVVAGWTMGLEASAHTLDTNANNGVETFELATPEIEDSGEVKPFLTLLEGNVDATATAFENGFAS